MIANKIVVDIVETSTGARPLDDLVKKVNALGAGGGSGGGMGAVIVAPTIVTPVDGAVGVTAAITSSIFKVDPSYSGTHVSSDWEVATDAAFTAIVDNNLNDTINLTSYAPPNIPGGVVYYIRVRHSSDKFVSSWSVGISYTAKNIFITPPSVTITGGPNSLGRTTTITGSAFNVVGGTDTHASTDWKVKDATGSVIHSVLGDAANLTSYTLPYGILKPANTYTFEIVYNGTTVASSASGVTSGTTIASFPVITRGVIAGGRSASASLTHIEYLTIPNLSACAVFGALKSVRYMGVGVTDGSRGVVCAGSGSSVYAYIANNEYIAIATASNSLTFGSVSNYRASSAGVNDYTTGVIAGGNYYYTYRSDMEYIKISTLATAKYFGNLSLGRPYLNGLSGSGRGAFIGGYAGAYLQTMSYITIATLGNSLIFSTYPTRCYVASSISSNGRGILAGGSTGIVTLSTMQYIDMAVLGNAKLFGSLTTSRNNCNGVADNTKGVIPGGNATTTAMRDMEYINTQTLGNAKSFGKLIVGRYSHAAMSGS